MTLSIIIPIYNVEKYLSDCLNSVLACDLTDCEIILSLRDSQDHSAEISEAYQLKYPVIRIIKQDGVGLSNARNCAMRVARGEYVLFIDSDDSVDSPILDCLISRLREGGISSDVVVTDFYHVEHPSGRVVPFFQIGEATPEQVGMQFLPQMLRRRQCFWNVWRYIYRRSFLEKHQITFLENMLSEDVDYTTSVFIADPEILFSHSPFYFYNVGRGDSLMDRPTLRRLRETVAVLSDSVERLRQSLFPYADVMCAQFQFEYILNMALAVEIEPNEQESALKLFEEYEEVLCRSCDAIVRCYLFFIRIVGVRMGAILLHCLKQVRRRIKGRAYERRAD